MNNTTQTTHSVASEVMLAYADVYLPFEEAEPIRNRHFQASLPVTVKEAIEIFNKVGGKNGFQYNEFEPKLLKHLGMDTLVTIAREGSVCIYVHNLKTWGCHTSNKQVEKARTKMHFDEADYDDDMEAYRLWWD